MRVCDVNPKRTRLRSAHHRVLLRVSGFQRRKRADYTLSYAKALKKTRCETIETTISKRRLFFAVAAARIKEGRLPRRVKIGGDKQWGGLQTRWTVEELT